MLFMIHSQTVKEKETTEVHVKVFGKVEPAIAPLGAICESYAKRLYNNNLHAAPDGAH